MKTAFGRIQGNRRRLRLIAAGALALSILAAPALAQEAEAPKSPEDITPSGTISLFDAESDASVESFFFHSPEAVFPFKVAGGFLQSAAQATSSPRAFGYAGPAPVPLFTSAGIIIPEEVPGTGLPIPDAIRRGFQSIDYTALPNYCQASFPATKEGGEESFCGGPAQTNTAMGFSSASVNGHVKVSGDFEDSLATKTLAESRGQDVFIPALQATYHAAYAKAETGLNNQGVPQGAGVAEFKRAQFLGSLVVLEDVRSRTIVATDGTDAGTATRSTLTVGGAAVFGLPVVITTEGVTVAEEAVPNSGPKPLTDQLNKQMAEMNGLTVRLIPAPEVRKAGSEVTAESGSIEIAYDSEEPTPVRVVHRVAYTRAAVNALVDTGGFDLDLPGTQDSGSSLDSGSGESSTTSYEPTLDSSYDSVASDTAASYDSSALEISAGAFPSYDSSAYSSSADLGPSLSPSDFSTGYEFGADSAALPDESSPAATDVTVTGDQALLTPPALMAVPAALNTLPADELTNFYVGFGILAAAVIIVLPLRRALMGIGK